MFRSRCKAKVHDVVLYDCAAVTALDRQMMESREAVERSRQQTSEARERLARLVAGQPG